MTESRAFQILVLVLVGSLPIKSIRGEESQSQQPPPEHLEFFEKEVRPLLSKHCYECHSVGADRIEASLLLDSREAHLRGGDSGASVVPGEADQSLLIEAVRYESYEMPPKGKLADKDIATLERWVNLGAPWPEEESPTADARLDEFDLQKRKSEFWVWQPIQKIAPPKVSNRSWPRSEIDHHILAGLEKANLQPAGDADRSAVLRRLYFDLVGLPPTKAEVDAFLADAGSDAVEKVVDDLLDSPHFGERWGRHWLDLVRYAESRGHEFDNDAPNAFHYRDYVIRALNADVPYDQFVREHIAGDLLPKPRLHPTEEFNESVLGTGFWFLGEWVHSPVDIRKDEADRFDNMLDVMSKTFLGITVACARCHDHKFDAISTADYYSLSGFLQSSDYRQVRFESMEQNRRVASQLAKTDAKYQREILEFLENEGLSPPPKPSGFEDDAIVVDYTNVPPHQYMQDGHIFGRSPRIAGQVYLDLNSNPIVKVATRTAAVNDSIWSGLQSITEGTVHSRSSVAKLPKSGRTLRSPTFELKHGNVDCLVSGVGHIVACVDSHRMVAGPLHKQTIKPVNSEKKSRRRSSGGQTQWVRMDLTRYAGHRLHLEFIPAQDSQLAVRMVTQGLDAKGLADIDRRLEAVDSPFQKFAKAAGALVGGESEFKEQVFEDFESGSYGDWTVTGDAFGRAPQTLETIADYQGQINIEGTFFVNSHNVRDGNRRKGDQATGSLTSPEFKIDCDSIDFMIGGGAHAGKTCVNLIIEGKVERTATGTNNNRMVPKRWDVRSLVGKTAKIQVVDDHTSGWGNIGIDHIVFQKRIDKVSRTSEKASSIVNAWKRERVELASQIVRKSRVAPAMMDGTGEDDHVLIRGNAAKPGDVEPRHFLTAVTSNAPMKIQYGSGRLELAQQINNPANPLTSRVIVNRIWHHLMGRGIVPTTDDFGFLGQRPTNPELLDHLAIRFRADGQSIKRMIKYIVLSRTYQMSSHTDPKALEADPKNLLWHHRPPRRLQGEAIRDALLALSGSLDRTAFGAPVPIHLTSFMDGRGRPKQSGPLDGHGRRSIYISVRRNFLSPFMLTFDAPVPFSSMGRRNVSNVPAQALIMLNDPLVAKLSREWSHRALEIVPGDGDEAIAERIHWMYMTGFGRPPTDAESQTASEFLSSQVSKSDAKSSAAELWAAYAHVLVNTKEFIFIR